MNQSANVKARALAPSAFGATYWLSSLLACNTFLLWALDSYSAIPGWLKVAATFFLRF